MGDEQLQNLTMYRYLIFAALCGLAVSSFVVHTEKKMFDEAEEVCKNAGGHLATIADANQQALLAKQLNEKGTYWIGLRRNFSENDYTWVDGSSASFRNWDSIETIKERLYTHAAIYNESNENRRMKWIGTFGYRKH